MMLTKIISAPSYFSRLFQRLTSAIPPCLISKSVSPRVDPSILNSSQPTVDGVRFFYVFNKAGKIEIVQNPISGHVYNVASFKTKYSADHFTYMMNPPTTAPSQEADLLAYGKKLDTYIAKFEKLKVARHPSHQRYQKLRDHCGIPMLVEDPIAYLKDQKHKWVTLEIKELPNERLSLCKEKDQLLLRISHFLAHPTQPTKGIYFPASDLALLDVVDQAEFSAAKAEGRSLTLCGRGFTWALHADGRITDIDDDQELHYKRILFSAFSLSLTFASVGHVLGFQGPMTMQGQYKRALAAPSQATARHDDDRSHRAEGETALSQLQASDVGIPALYTVLLMSMTMPSNFLALGSLLSLISFAAAETTDSPITLDSFENYLLILFRLQNPHVSFSYDLATYLVLNYGCGDIYATIQECMSPIESLNEDSNFDNFNIVLDSIQTIVGPDILLMAMQKIYTSNSFLIDQLPESSLNGLGYSRDDFVSIEPTEDSPTTPPPTDPPMTPSSQKKLLFLLLLLGIPCIGATYLASKFLRRNRVEIQPQPVELVRLPDRQLPPQPQTYLTIQDVRRIEAMQEISKKRAAHFAILYNDQDSQSVLLFGNTPIDIMVKQWRPGGEALTLPALVGANVLFGNNMTVSLLDDAPYFHTQDTVNIAQQLKVYTDFLGRDTPRRHRAESDEMYTDRLKALVINRLDQYRPLSAHPQAFTDPYLVLAPDDTHALAYTTTDTKTPRDYFNDLQDTRSFEDVLSDLIEKLNIIKNKGTRNRYPNISILSHIISQFERLLGIEYPMDVVRSSKLGALIRTLMSLEPPKMTPLAQSDLIDLAIEFKDYFRENAASTSALPLNATQDNLHTFAERIGIDSPDISWQMVIMTVSAHLDTIALRLHDEPRLYTSDTRKDLIQYIEKLWDLLNIHTCIKTTHLRQNILNISAFLKNPTYTRAINNELEFLELAHHLYEFSIKPSETVVTPHRDHLGVRLVDGRMGWMTQSFDHNPVGADALI